MLVVGAVTSSLAENVRSQARVAEHRERRASALYRLSKELAEARLETEIIEIGVRHIHAEFGGRNTFLFPDRNGLVCYPDEPPLDISLQGADLGVARWVLNNGQMAGNGTGYLTQQNGRVCTPQRVNRNHRRARTRAGQFTPDIPSGTTSAPGHLREPDRTYPGKGQPGGTSQGCNLENAGGNPAELIAQQYFT